MLEGLACGGQVGCLLGALCLSGFGAAWRRPLSRRIPAAKWTANRSRGAGEQCSSGRKALVCDFPMPSPPGALCSAL